MADTYLRCLSRVPLPMECPWCEDVPLAVMQYLEGALGGWQRPPM